MCKSSPLIMVYTSITHTEINLFCYSLWYHNIIIIIIIEDKLKEFEQMALMRILGPKRDEVTGGWRTLHNEELRNLFFSPSIIRMIKSMKMRWAGNDTLRGEERIACKLLGVKTRSKETTRKTKTYVRG
jgi:hypothetical protein